jgi:hypothetical protein
MPRRTPKIHDIVAREKALQAGHAVAGGQPVNEKEVEQRIGRLERRLEDEGPDGPRGVSGQSARSRSEIPKDRR